jgi:Flp pilus assembly protein TadB
MKALLRTLLLVLPLLLVAPDGFGQEGVSRKKQEKIQAAKAKQEKKDLKKKERDDRNRHLSIQDKPTRKRVKHNTKRADKHGSGRHRDGFLHRLFTRKR